MNTSRSNKMHILLVLQQGAGQRRHHGLLVLGAQGFGRNVLGDQQLQPVDQLGGGGLLLQARHIAQLEEDFHGFAQQILFQVGEMHVDDARHGLLVGKLDVVEEAAAQEGVGQFLFVVRGDDDDAAARLALTVWRVS